MPNWNRAEKIRQLFNLLDNDGTGFIESRELAELGQVLSRNWTAASNERLLRMIQRDGSNRVSPSDFEQFIMGSLQQCYRTLDVNNNGRLESVELEPISRAFNQNHSEMMQGSVVAGPDQFVQFVVEQSLRGLQRGQVVQGLGAVLVMGGDGIGARGSQPEGRLLRLFHVLDSNSNGYLESSEIGWMGTAMSQHWGAGQNQRLMRMLDSTQDGRVHFPEFRNFMTHMLLTAFDHLDSNREGLLDGAELRAVSNALCRDHNEMMRSFGGEHGRIDRGVFIDFIISNLIVGMKTGQINKGLGELIVLGGKRLRPTGACSCSIDLFFCVGSPLCLANSFCSCV